MTQYINLSDVTITIPFALKRFGISKAVEVLAHLIVKVMEKHKGQINIVESSSLGTTFESNGQNYLTVCL